MEKLMLMLTLISHILAGFLLEKPRFNKYITGVIWGIYGIVFIWLISLDNMVYAFFISFVLHIVFFVFSTKGYLRDKLFLLFSYAAFYVSFIGCTQIISYFLNVQFAQIQALFSTVLLIVLQLLFYMVFVPGYRDASVYIKKGYFQYFILIILCLFLFVVQTLYPYTVAKMEPMQVVLLTVQILVFYSAYVILFFGIKHMAELAIGKQKELNHALLMERVEAQNREAGFLRESRHDIRHHNQHILNLANNGDLDGIVEYLKMHTNNLEETVVEHYCENEVINNILSVYEKKAVAQNVKMTIRASAERELKIQTPDLVAILANIVENALHGAVESGKEEPFIAVRIYRKDERFVMVCKNSCNEKHDYEDDFPENKRGVGISSICNTADKYSGNYRFVARDGEFQCTVILKI